MVEGDDVFEVNGSSVAVDYVGAKSKRDRGAAGDNRGEENTMFVKNLSWSADENTLKQVFEKATAVRIPLNDQNQSRGWVTNERSLVFLNCSLISMFVFFRPGLPLSSFHLQQT